MFIYAPLHTKYMDSFFYVKPRKKKSEVSILRYLLNLIKTYWSGGGFYKYTTYKIHNNMII